MRHFKPLLPVGTVVCGILFAGCKQTQTAANTTPTPQQQALAQQSSPELRMSDHKAWINRLLATPPIDQGIQQVSGVGGDGMMLPIPTPPSFNTYMLQVSQQSQLAWLVSNGERHGPWKLDNPDVVHLLKSLHPPVTAGFQQ